MVTHDRISTLLSLLNFRMSTDTILLNISLILCPMFGKQNLPFPSKEMRVGNLQLVCHLGNIQRLDAGDHATNNLTAWLVIAGSFEED